MAAGCGVVALDAPGPRDVVGPAAGILVPARASVAEFASALAGALERAGSFRPAALNCAASFDLDLCTERLLEAYMLGQKTALAGSLFG